MASRGKPGSSKGNFRGSKPSERVVAENLAFHLRVKDRGGSDFKKRNGHGSEASLW